MERRKLQLLRGTTLSVSIPKAWVQAMGLNPGVPVDLEPRNDGTLILRTVRPSNSEPTRRRATLNAAGLTAEQLERRVINLYLGGCERMHRDVVATLAERDAKRLAGVPARYDDINRLAWVVGKHQRLALDMGADGNAGAKLQELLAFASATSLVQGMGANGVQLAEAARPLIETAIDPRVLASAVEVGSAALSFCDEAARAFSKADLQAADSAMSKVAPLEQRIAELRGFASRTAASGIACGPCLGTGRVLERMQASRTMGTRLAHIATERALASDGRRSQRQ